VSGAPPNDVNNNFSVEERSQQWMLQYRGLNGTSVYEILIFQILVFKVVFHWLVGHLIT
jgi:hypothetical protein